MSRTRMKKGGRELSAFLRGEVLNQNKRVMAKCFDCMGHYDDGALDCQIDTCPLYPDMPYREEEEEREECPTST